MIIKTCALRTDTQECRFSRRSRRKRTIQESKHGLNEAARPTAAHPMPPLPSVPKPRKSWPQGRTNPPPWSHSSPAHKSLIFLLVEVLSLVQIVFLPCCRPLAKRRVHGPTWTHERRCHEDRGNLKPMGLLPRVRERGPPSTSLTLQSK